MKLSLKTKAFARRMDSYELLSRPPKDFHQLVGYLIHDLGSAAEMQRLGSNPDAVVDRLVAVATAAMRLADIVRPLDMDLE